MNQDRTKRKLTAILSADVVGYSRLMEEDEGWTIKTLEDNKRLIFEFIEEYKGRVVDAPGDNILAEFSSVTNAVECAVKIQQKLKSKNANLIKDRRMEFRIGVNLGEVVEEDGRIYGSGVNIAARLEGLTEAGGVCISRRAYDHVKTQLDLSYEYLGEQCVKNISEPIRVYRILMDSKTGGKVIGEKRFLGRMSRRMALASIIFLIFIAAGLIAWILYAPQFMEEKGLKTIAVLPFDDLSPESDQANFVDGLSEEILMSLEQIPNLTVIARTSSFLFKGTNKTNQDIGSALGADYILRGSIRKAGDTLRIIVRLIKSSDNSSIWSKKYDINFDVKEILAIHEDIANKVAHKLKLTLEAFQLLGGTENIKAYELYLNAKGKRAETNVSGFIGALELIDEAIVFDPGFALAYAFKAHNHILLSMFGPYKQALREAKAGLKAIQKAISLEPNLGDVYLYLSTIEATKNDWIGSEHNIHKALELIDESSSENEYFIFAFYFSVGNFKRVHELLDKMQKNNRTNQIISGFYYPTFGLMGDRKRAEEKYQNRNLLLKGYSDWHDDTITEVRLGSGDILSSDEIVSSNRIHTTGKKYLASPEEGLEELSRIYHNDEKLSSIDLSYISMWAAYFGDTGFAMEAIEKVTRSNGTQVGHFWVPILKEVRQLPRFKKLMREIGLVDYWKEFGWPDNNLCHPVGDDDFVCE